MRTSLFCSTKKSLLVERGSDPRHVKERFNWLDVPDRQEHTPASFRMRNTTTKRRHIAKQSLGQLRTATERQNADIIARDLNTSAYRERGKARESCRRSVGKDPCGSLPFFLVPMWSQMEDSGDRCGFISATRSVPTWRVAVHGSLQTKEDLQTRAADQEAPKWRVARNRSLQLTKKRCE